MKCKPSFFGSSSLPQIDLDPVVLEQIAKESVDLGVTVPGVQKKLSMHLSEEGPLRLTLVGYPAGYILKPQTEDFEQLPESEDLVMDIAEMMGVRTAPHGLIETSSGFAYITKRMDRADGQVFAMEDFCQLSGRLTQDKYKGSYERCGAIIRQYSERILFDLSEFFLRLLVCFVTGNSDMHLKNFSMIERDPASRQFVLAPAYDLLPVNVVMPEDTEETALTLNGKKSRLQRRDFLALAKTIGLPDHAAENLLQSVVKRCDAAKQLCEDSYLSPERKARMIELIEKRMEVLRS